MQIVNHPFIKAIGFTGSFKGGKALFDAANQRSEPIPVFAEMGSINPVFILPGIMKAKTESIVSGLIGSISMGVGQFCTNPGLVVGMKSDDFNAYIQSQSGTIEAGVMLSEGIQKNYRKGINKFKAIDEVTIVGIGKDQTIPIAPQ